ncbi:polyhydroxyalkanoate depolymerase [Methylobacterium nodulans]|uniref:Polyhydroxyalkanoate depolymerase, intracellular n=1 Tax=Methylobacterium nodulans (strain LMG 21967 / CNCM I-2342 / ORS 2060) TaxID=460265 RepID=B8IXY4_METNO|nr:polyhydroxyalkanoate depolymerase [Methylobacterium nodulans]ACL63274.1 polyhydroxyalkanoate depolymerase, intracellular [Methylobacterium nodulans ORS 2060]
MIYLLRESCGLMLAPARVAAKATELACENPLNLFSCTPTSRALAASCELFERATRAYPKPAFNLSASERVVWEQPFCRVIAFGEPSDKPKLLLVAPMSGHYATLLRGTVAAFLDTHQVFITDWSDARQVPLAAGRFGLDEYIDYCMALFEALGPDLHVMAVCQPSVPVLAAIARMEAEDHPLVPRSATLLGGPIDTRRSPTAVNDLAQQRGLAWFEHCIHEVPWSAPGRGRRVYPGFLQLTGFMGMNLDRHLTAHRDMFKHLVQGDGDSAAKHREFYDEYLAVMDLTAEFFLQTVETVFIAHALPRGVMRHRGEPVDLGAIRRCALMAIEGEKDDITGVGQTRAALDLTTSLLAGKKAYHLQAGAGHYGVFNGSRFRAEVAPRIKAFMEQNAGRAADLTQLGAGRQPAEDAQVIRFTSRRAGEALEDHTAVDNSTLGRFAPDEVLAHSAADLRYVGARSSPIGG